MDNKVRVAIVGVGNCASSLVQGVHYYRNADEKKSIPGLMHVNLGGYHIRDIEFVAAFDINRTKVGKDISKAIFADPNNTYKFSDVPEMGVTVQRGMTHDGIGKYLSDVIKKAPGSTVDIVKVLKETKADMMISYLPVGSEEATKWYVEQALQAKVGFINAIPVFIASSKYWSDRFKKEGLPIIGDDIKSQVGATITHRVLAQLFNERGVRLRKAFQLNVGCHPHTDRPAGTSQQSPDHPRPRLKRKTCRDKRISIPFDNACTFKRRSGIRSQPTLKKGTAP